MLLKFKCIYVFFKASPGNLAQFDDILFNNSGTEMTVNNGVMGIRIGNVDKTKVRGVEEGYWYNQFGEHWFIHQRQR